MKNTNYCVLQNIDGSLNEKITGVQFFGSLNISTQTHEINAREHVWLVMKSVFENKNFIISKDGVINELLN